MASTKVSPILAIIALSIASTLSAPSASEISTAENDERVNINIKNGAGLKISYPSGEIIVPSERKNVHIKTIDVFEEKNNTPPQPPRTHGPKKPKNIDKDKSPPSQKQEILRALNLLQNILKDNNKLDQGKKNELQRKFQFPFSWNYPNYENSEEMMGDGIQDVDETFDYEETAVQQEEKHELSLRNTLEAIVKALEFIVDITRNFLQAEYMKIVHLLVEALQSLLVYLHF